MKTRLFILAATGLLALAFVRCGEASKAVLKQTADEVMAVHDEVMPKMKMLSQLQPALKQLRDSLATTKVPTADLAAIDSASANIKAAETAMNTWMDSYDFDFEKNLDAAAAIGYIQGQLKQVHSVKGKLLDAIERAQIVLQKYGKSLPKRASEAADATHEAAHGTGGHH